MDIHFPWRRKSECGILEFVMAKRPEPAPTVLTRAELNALQKRLSEMSVIAVRDFYGMALYRCRLEEDRIPDARAVQELVAAWRNLRKMYRRSS
jgi:hypothetical protein